MPGSSRSGEAGARPAKWRRRRAGRCTPVCWLRFSFARQDRKSGMTNPNPILTILGILVASLSIAAGLIWLERRLLAGFQDRYGPNRAGPFGLLQVLADMIKIVMKEDWIPPFADRTVFVLAPAVIVMTVLMSFAVLPIAPGVIVADLNIGVLFVLGMSSLGVYSVV